MRFILLALTLSFSASGVAQYTPRPVPPSDTTVPVGARLLITVIGQGVQIYKCKQNNGSLAWSFEAPEGKQTGILTPVVWVRRSETKGGVGPSRGCDKVHEGESIRVPYQALYTFYSKD